MPYLALLISCAACFVSARLLYGLSQIDQLDRWLAVPKSIDSVTIIVPARNESQHVTAAVSSLLAVDYPNLQLIAVNDRSTDDTGQRLDRLAQLDSRLRVVHVNSLPPSWLGKNHALQLGAEMADGDWLLFADADITMSKDVLKRAISYVQEKNLDHLAATPGMVMPGAMLKFFSVAFITVFCSYFKPWRARIAGSSQYVGIGAFNLIRRSAYFEAGGHAAIRMRPDDDMMLGKLLKLAGYRQDTVHAVGLLSVPWYGSLPEVIHGLEKNAFSGVNYRIATVLFGTIAGLSVLVWPYIATLCMSGWPQVIYAIACVALWIMAMRIAMWMRFPMWTAFGFPLGVVLILFIQWRAMWLTLFQRGIRWRDTFYPLDELKANQLPSK